MKSYRKELFFHLPTRRGLVNITPQVEEALRDYEMPGAGVTHRVVLIRKTAPTPKGSPRRWAKLQKAPL